MKTPSVLALSGMVSILVPTLAPSAAGQTYVTSPAGLLNTGGNASFAMSTNRRFQIVDNTHAKTVLTIKDFGIRRRTGTTGPAAHTVDVTLDMGLANMGVISRVMDRNFLPNSRQNVHSKKSVNFPDWSQAATGLPPFDFVFTLDTPYVYTGAGALIWDLILQNGTSGATWDRDYTGATAATGTSLGAGCTATGRTSAFNQAARFENNGAVLPKYGMRFRVGCTNGPASAVTLLSLAVADANASIPGWCTSLRADPLALLPIGLTSATGQIPDLYLSAPYNAGIQGLKLFSQLAAPDSGQAAGLVLSNGVSTTMPTSSATTGHESLYIWASYSASTVTEGTAFPGGSMIVRFGL